MLRQVLRFDLFRVVQDRERHLTPATTEGAAVSAITIGLMCILILSETIAFFQPDIRSSMSVDRNEHRKEPVHFNVSFTKIPCHHMVVEIFDPQTGASVPELSDTIHYKLMRILSDSPSVVVGEYMRHSGRIPTTQNDAHEGCRVSGSFSIDKVPGNFYIAGKNDIDIRAMPPSDHIIHELWIGEERMDQRHDHIPESLANALGGVQHQHEDPPHTLYQYFLQIVPTYFEHNGVVSKLGYQYTATFSKAHGPDTLPPGVYFRHQHTALAVEYRWEYQSWTHFLVHVSAVVGGVYTVMGFAAVWVESWIGAVLPLLKTRLAK